MIDPVIGVAELAALGGGAALADVRWFLTEPERGRSDYEASHIPGAVFIDLDTDLCAPSGPGRHPLPAPEWFAARMGELGFEDDDLIVAYDDGGGAIAARLWWMLRSIGHAQVRVLDGGLAAWQRAGHPLQTGSARRRPATMSVRRGLTRQLDREQLEGMLGRVVLLDARAPERFRGDEEPIDPVAGHIPTARNAPTAANLAEDGTFLDPSRLRRTYERLGVGPKIGTVVYCGSGVTACHDALALVRAGFPEPILYPGSWSDWASAGGAVATGD